MNGPFQRLRYFDGEFLRSGDFSDEQAYHVALRRYLNLKLHLSGIVTGLQIALDAGSVPGASYYAIKPGFAIDQLGREIYVTAPFTMSTDNVLGRAGLITGPHEVWIVYTEAATGLPAPGYALCDQPAQNTRWSEGFDVILRPLSGKLPAGTQDPDTDLSGICLGMVLLNYDLINGWTIAITASVNAGRTYVGIRAQSIVAPDDVDPDNLDFTLQNVVPVAGPTVPAAPPGFLDVQPGTFVRGDMFVERNMVLGDDYALGALPSGPPPANGNLKMNGALFVKGGMFGLDPTGAWVEFRQFVKSMIPDIVFPTPVSVTLTAPVNTAGPISVPTTLAAYSRVDVMASIAGVQFLSPPDMTAFNGGPATVHPTFTAGATGPAGGGSGPASINVTVTADGVQGGKYIAVTVYVALVVIFHP